MPGSGSAAVVDISIARLGHAFPTPAGEIRLFDGLDLAVEAATYVALTGRSGSGKSTLLALIGGLERVQAGTVLVDGTDVAALSGDELAEYRRRTVGFVFQHYGLLDHLDALENVELALTFGAVSRGIRRRRAEELLAEFGLAHRLHHRPTQLSGGERQRVAMARAVANQPAVLLADELTGNLDPTTAAEVLDRLDKLNLTFGCTVVVATHDVAVAARAERVYELGVVPGRLVEVRR